jgi:hypothetical protein
MLTFDLAVPEDKWKDSSVGGRVLQDKRVDEQEKIRTKVLVSR